MPRSVWDVKCPSAPHVWAWLKDGSGKKFVPGYAWSCLGPSGMTFEERITKDAVLLKPTQKIHGSLVFETKTFSKQLEPGVYRLVVEFSGWRDNKFGESARLQMVKMAHPFLQGEVTASTQIELTR